MKRLLPLTGTGAFSFLPIVLRIYGTFEASGLGRGLVRAAVRSPPSPCEFYQSVDQRFSDRC